MSDFTVEPELIPPPPRRVRYRDGFGAGCGAWFLRLLMLPHTIAGICFLLAALGTTGTFLGVLVLGHEYEGRVIKKVESRSSKGIVSYEVTYEFVVDDQEYTDRVWLNEERFAEVKEGDAIFVRAMDFAPQKGHWPRLPGHWPIRGVGAAWLVALFWNGVMSFFIWHMYVRTWRQWWLIRDGIPTMGIVRQVTEQQNKGSKSYRIEYEYTVTPTDGSEGRTFTGRITSTVKGAELAAKGDLVTVLYHPRKPHRSVAYRYSDYRAA